MIKDYTTEGKVEVTGLITKCDKGKTLKGTPYLSIILEDSSGALDCKFWNLTDEQTEMYTNGMIVDVCGDIIIHRNAIQLRIRTMKENKEANMVDYVRRSVMPREEMEKEVEGYMSTIEDEALFAITQTILDDVKESFYTYTAATKNHHNFVGGLAQHSIYMTRVALKIQELYPWLNRDLLICGCLLHDIGKIEELSSPVLPEYTNEGNLIGHISLMGNRVDRTAFQLGIDKEESVLLLKHMILSHHGKTEFGSPVLPMIPEAEILSIVDNMDARLFMMKASIDATQPGSFGPRIFALENRMFYKRKG